MLKTICFATLAALSFAAPAPGFFKPKVAPRFFKTLEHEGSLEGPDSDDPCDLNELDAIGFINSAVCAPVKAVAPATNATNFITPPTTSQILAMYRQLCETPACMDLFYDAQQAAFSSAACTAHGAPPAEFFDLICKSRDPDTMCLEILLGMISDDSTAYSSYCAAKYDTNFEAAFDDDNVDYICCGVAEMGCCGPEIFGSFMEPAQYTSFSDGIEQICPAGTWNRTDACNDIFLNSCFIPVTLTFSVFSGAGAENVVKSQIASEYGVNVGDVTVTAVLQAAGSSNVNVHLSVRISCDQVQTIQDQLAQVDQDQAIEDFNNAVGNSSSLVLNNATVEAAQTVNAIVDAPSPAASLVPLLGFPVLLALL